MTKLGKKYKEAFREAIKDSLSIDVMYEAVDAWIEDYFTQEKTTAILELGHKDNVAHVGINVMDSDWHFVTVPLDYVTSVDMESYDIEDVKYQLKTLEKFIGDLNDERNKYLAYLEQHK